MANEMLEKKDSQESGPASTAVQVENGRSWAGKDHVPGQRICPVLPHLENTAREVAERQSVKSDAESAVSGDIKVGKSGWTTIAALLLAEYICLAIMSFPNSYATLGLIPALILTVAVAAVVLYTSLIVWKFCLRHPEVRDACDIGQMLFGGKWAWWVTAIMFILNNTFIQGLHVLVIAEYLNTVSGHGLCTVGFSAIGAFISWCVSLSREFDTLAKGALVSAFFTFTSVLLATIFAGIQSHPAGYTEALGDPTWSLWPAKTVTFVAGMNAFLNISYTFIGQITLPTFIADMEKPQDFPKALILVTAAEIVIFATVGSVIYVKVGNEYVTAPAFGSLGSQTEKLVAFSFMIPTLIFLGVLYASVTARFVHFRIFDNSKHKYGKTAKGWGTWAAILAATWIGAFIIAEVVPFFSDLLALMSSLFDSFFGFIFWGLAFWRMVWADRKSSGVNTDGNVTVVQTFWTNRTWGQRAELVLNAAIILIGLFFLVAGTYTSVESIIMGYQDGSISGIFTCTSNGI